MTPSRGALAHKAFIVATTSRIEPLGDPSREALVLNLPLAEYLKRECEALGWEVTTEVDFESLPRRGPYLILPDDLFITRYALKAFVRQAAGQDRTVQLGLAASRFLEESGPLQEGTEPVDGDPAAAVFSAARVSGPPPRSWEEVRAAPSVLVDLEIEERQLDRLPRALVEEGSVKFPLTSRPLMRLSHWVHVVRANQYALLALAAGYREPPRWRGRAKLLWALLRSFPPTPARIGRALVRKGKRCKIHPTAVVEASILGNDVTIGPHATVRGSVLGDRSALDANAQADLCVLGPDSSIGKQTWATFVVLYPGAALTAHAQMTLLGRDSFVATYSPLQDLSLTGDVKVERRGKIVSSGSRFLGVCIGHEARVGGGVFVAHGRAIPNGALLIKNPAEIVCRVEEGAGPLTVVDGTAKPLSALHRRSGKPS